MSTTVPVNPELIRWAIDRSGLSADKLGRFPVEKWESGEKQPTLIQLEAFAKQTMTPFGYLFLSEPPEEELAIPDFRTLGDTPIDRPSPNLIDTLQTMRRRQAWMRDYLIEQGQEKLRFIGGVSGLEGVDALAERIRKTLGMQKDWASKHRTWEDALRALRTAAEDIGVMVATSSVVGLNTHRALDPEEFRGFVLSDDYAPLIFVNGADSKSAQMFTMAHELAHLWLGRDGLFNLVNMQPFDDATERFCNQVAAEFLVSRQLLSDRWAEAAATDKPFDNIARWFKVSPLVAARRALDLRLITKAAFFVFYNQYKEEWQQQKALAKASKRGGPNFYDVQDVRLGRRFAYAVIRAAREGRLLYRDAYQLTDLNGSTFDRYAVTLTKRMRDERE
jgi:Zn-dependent peptidase ImmA (M78 family)